MTRPLAEILRPGTIETYIGQSHLMGKDGVLRAAIENKNLHSMILWGPPGVGKTTLALLLAELTGVDFYMLSAINSGVKDIREVFDKVEKSGRPSILFIDEIHRFSKSQQDSLLGAVERGLVTLIGATTENPSFEVISPLLSRCQVYVLKSLEKEDLEKILETARAYLEKELHSEVMIDENEALLRISGGDARKLINAVELAATSIKPVDGVIRLNNEAVLKVIQKNLALYDKKGENHYDVISAFIKSIRGSDPNAAVYWLARMLTGGEDPLFIARRMIILASEDIGNANPNALLLANSCFQAVHQIGMPEAQLVLSQTAIYLASSPKSNASCVAIGEAMSWVKKTGDLPVPLHIRNAPTKLMKDLGYSKGYQYAHHYEENFVDQEFLPQSISGKKFYEPQDNPRENELRRYLKKCWKDKYRYVILLLVSLCCFRFGYSQDIHYSQFYAAPLDMNPAFTGVYDGILRGSLHYRNQWLAVTEPFVTCSFDFDMPVYKNNRRNELFGAGINLTSDKAGDSKYRALQANISVSYVKGLGTRNRFKIGLGFYGGIAQRSLHYTHLYFDEQFQSGFFDPQLPVSETFPSSYFFFFDCGAGIFGSFAPDRDNLVTLGVSVNHLNRPDQSLYNEKVRMNIKPLVYVNSKIQLTRDLLLLPAVFTAFQGKYKEITFGTNIEYFIRKNSYSYEIAFGGGIFYRWKDALIIAALIEWKNLKLGLSYDVNLSSFLTATRGRGGFEVTLAYLYRKPSVTRIGREPCPFGIM